MVLPFSSAACNATTRIVDCMHMCWRFRVFLVNKMSYFSIHRPGPLLFFQCTDSYYAYKMTKCIQNVLEVQNIQEALQFQCHRLPHFQCRLKISWNGSIYSSFLIWLSKPHVKRNQTHLLVVLFNRIHHSYDIISHNVCILCSHWWNLLFTRPQKRGNLWLLVSNISHDFLTAWICCTYISSFYRLFRGLKYKGFKEDKVSTHQNLPF